MYFEGALTDITERKQHERELEVSPRSALFYARHKVAPKCCRSSQIKPALLQAGGAALALLIRLRWYGYRVARGHWTEWADRLPPGGV
jgi:hypothetical protein